MKMRRTFSGFAVWFKVNWDEMLMEHLGLRLEVAAKARPGCIFVLSNVKTIAG